MPRKAPAAIKKDTPSTCPHIRYEGDRVGAWVDLPMKAANGKKRYAPGMELPKQKKLPTIKGEAVSLFDLAEIPVKQKPSRTKKAELKNQLA